MIKAADMLIARRADTRARADFATWKMMAKLNGTSSLPMEAQNFLVGYKAHLKEMTEAEATAATIHLIYKSYYEEMGGTGIPPNIEAHSNYPATDNVTAFKRPPAKPPKSLNGKSPSASPVGGAQAKSRLPVALIFACLVVAYAGLRYLMH